jgi:hypothetical protein
VKTTANKKAAVKAPVSPTPKVVKTTANKKAAVKAPVSPTPKVVKTTANKKAAVKDPVHQMPENVKIRANESKNVQLTINAIYKLTKEPEFKGKDILVEIKKILNLQFNYHAIVKGNQGKWKNEREKLEQGIERRKLSEAIYLYEKKKAQEGNSKINPVGYIVPNGNTYKLLKKQIKENFTKKNN